MRTEITANDVCALARVVGLNIKDGNAAAIADMLSSIQANVLRDVSDLSQDTSICLLSRNVH
jgi:hypothetical protein